MDPPAQSAWAIDPSTLVPVSGTVTRDGQPLPKAIVAFMNSTGIPGVAETDEKGHYSLMTTELPGAIPGEYKVAISYIVSPEGEPQGLGDRSSMVQSEAMRAAAEQLAPEFSDFKRTQLSAKVGSKGGAFDYQVKSSIPAPKADAVVAPTDSSEAKKDTPPPEPASQEVPKPN